MLYQLRTTGRVVLRVEPRKAQSLHHGLRLSDLESTRCRRTGRRTATVATVILTMKEMMMTECELRHQGQRRIKGEPSTFGECGGLERAEGGLEGRGHGTCMVGRCEGRVRARPDRYERGMGIGICRCSGGGVGYMYMFQSYRERRVRIARRRAGKRMLGRARCD